MAGSTPSVHRDAGLDALRALAAIAVMGFHVLAAGGETLAPLDGLFAHGFRGVIVFFVLSGYLVSRGFLTRPVWLPGYLMRRSARIWPAYLAALVGITLLSGERLFLDHPLAYLTLTQNLDPRLLLAGSFAPAWTLHLEVWFYALLPVLMAALMLVGATRPTFGLILISLLAISSTMFHVAASIWPDQSMARVGSLSLPAMLWAFLPGIAVAWMESRHLRYPRILEVKPAAATAAVLMSLGWSGTLVSPIGLALQDVALATGTALLVAAVTRSRRRLDPRSSTGGITTSVVASLAWFGRSISYPFYLWQVPIVGLVVAAGITGWTAFGVVLVAATAVGFVSWRVVERPAIHVADQLITMHRGSDGAPPVDRTVARLEVEARTVP